MLTFTEVDEIPNPWPIHIDWTRTWQRYGTVHCYTRRLERIDIRIK